MMELCGYGCGREAKFPPTKGKRRWGCEPLWQLCPNKRKENSENRKKSRKPLSLEHKKQLSKLAKDRYLLLDNNYNSTWRLKIGIASKKLWKDQDYITKQSKIRTGKKRSDEFKKSQSNRSKGHPPTNKLTIEKIIKKYPLFYKVEEVRENPLTKEIQVRCKNHNCPNSKEKDGWFTPSGDQLHGRIGAIENPSGFEEMNLYCSDKCKQECPLYKARPSTIINNNNISKEKYYTPEEYQIWRQEVLLRANNLCEYCDEPAEHCHHTRPQKLEPFFSLDPDFGVACCEKCHYEKGHRDECSTGKLSNIYCNQ